MTPDGDKASQKTNHLKLQFPSSVQCARGWGQPPVWGLTGDWALRALRVVEPNKLVLVRRSELAFL